MSDDLNIWLDDAPIVAANGSNDFDIWLDDAPVTESNTTVTPTGVRRRVNISFIN